MLDVDKRVGHQGVTAVYYVLRRRLPAGPDIRFRLGKEGDVDLRFVPDRVVEHEYPNCTGGPVIAGTADGKLQFTGYRFEESGPLPPTETFLAWIERVEPGFTATISAFDGISQGGFVSPEPNEPLAAAEISPSAPFSGSASFALTSGRHAEWTGDLAVELSGYGRVPLTGPKFRAGLCETKACTPTLPKSLRPRTGNGKGGSDVSYFNEGGAAS